MSSPGSTRLRAAVSPAYVSISTVAAMRSSGEPTAGSVVCISSVNS